MNRLIARAACACAAAALAALAPSPGLAQVPPNYCAQIASLSTTGLVAGATNGVTGTPPAGLHITMAATLGTATAGTFRIVGNPGGTVTYAGPSPIPGTLSYTTTGTLPPGAIGLGFLIDSATGGTVNITAQCDAVQVPTTSQNALIALAALLLAIGTAVLYRRRSR